MGRPLTLWVTGLSITVRISGLIGPERSKPERRRVPSSKWRE